MLGPCGMRSLRRVLFSPRSAGHQAERSFSLKTRPELFKTRNLRFSQGRRFAHDNPADNPEFHSFIDNPPQLVKVGYKHGPGLLLLGRDRACSY